MDSFPVTLGSWVIGWEPEKYIVWPHSTGNTYPSNSWDQNTGPHGFCDPGYWVMVWYSPRKTKYVRDVGFSLGPSTLINCSTGGGGAW